MESGIKISHRPNNPSKKALNITKGTPDKKVTGRAADQWIWIRSTRAWKAKTEAARVRHELDLTQNAFAELLGVSLATVRKWERGTGEPSGAAKTLLAVARLNPEVIKEAVAVGKE